MRRFKWCAAILLTTLLILQCMPISAQAAESAGFADVTISADVSSQKIAVSGRISSGIQTEFTVILKEGETVAYLNQMSSDTDGSFSFQIPADFTYNDTFTLQLGGASAVEAYVQNFVVGEELSLQDVTVGASYSNQALTVSGKISPASAQTLTLKAFKAGVSILDVTFDSDANGAFVYKGKLSMQVGDKLDIQINGKDADTLYTTTVTVTNDNSVVGGGGSSSVTAYEITVTAGAGGSISPTTKKVNQNGSATFTIQADKGYKIKDVLVDGTSVGAVSTYTFEKVTKTHTISAQFVAAETAWNNPFTDVKEGDWCYSAVQFVNEKGLFSGTGAKTFSPNATMTRGMLVLVLYRLAGTPAGGKGSFRDVADGSAYADAIAWASSMGITNGTLEGLFNPNGRITRTEIAVILYRYAQKMGKTASPSGDLSGFTDAGLIGSYAVDAMKWAVGCNLIQGKQGNVLDPNGYATRAQVATILMRFVQQFAA